MKVLLINGSPHEKGCTYTALTKVAETIRKNGIETQIYHIGNKPVRGCIACGACEKLEKCVFEDDSANEILELIQEADALNATLAVEEDPAAYIESTYGTDTSSWLTVSTDGNYESTDLAEFMNGTGLVRNKDIPGFDALDLSAENDAFGTSDTQSVHYSASIAELLQANYDTYKELDGFDTEQIDLYIQNALTGEEAEGIAEQTYLVNATQIMLDVAAGTQEADIAQYWRTRNGTADQHTSFSVAYNITLAAQMAGADADYALVWAMGHGSNEGTTTGTFVDWINEICQ